MTSPLTAQVRPDKNGKLVTRHVKTDAAAGRTAPSMPAPKLTAPKDETVSREELVDEVANIIATPPENPTRYTRTPSARSVTESLRDFKDEATIKAVGDAMTDPDANPYLKSLIASSFYNEDPNLEGYLKAVISVSEIHATIEHYGSQLPSGLMSDTSNLFGSMGFKEREFKGEVTDEHVGYFQATLIANKLGIQPGGYPIKNIYYRQIEMIKADLDRIVPALPVLVPVLSRDYYRESYDDIANVMERIEASGHAPKDIGDVMIERQTQDLDLVEEILGNGVKPMSSGVL